MVLIGSRNGLSPIRHQAITWTNADLFSSRPLKQLKFESKYEAFLSNKSIWKPSAHCSPYCSGLNVLIHVPASEFKHLRESHAPETAHYSSGCRGGSAEDIGSDYLDILADIHIRQKRRI